MNYSKMAEPAASGSSSPGTDADDMDFDPTADELVNDYDDERTMDEEEAMSNDESVTEELNDLQKEGDMPLEELLAIYGCGREQSAVATASAAAVPSNVVGDVSSSSSGVGDETAVGNGRPDDGGGAEPEPMETSRLLRSDDIGGSSSDEEDDEDYDPDSDEYWKKNVQVGPDHQANIPEGLSPYDTTQVYETDDRLLWDPSKLSDAIVEQYNADIQRHNRANCEGVYTIPTGAHIRDDEQALYLLLQCNHDVSEALRRHRLQSIPPTDPMSLWSEEECRSFENGLRTYGKDFFQIQVNRVRTRSVGELIQFYYLWKKTERHDAFAARTRLEKKRYTMHPGITDYMDRFLDEMDNPLTESQGSAISSSEVRYGATSCDGGSPVPAAIPPSSSLESTAAVSSLHQGPVASAEDAVDDDKNQQSVTCASGKSVAGKNCCDSAGSSSACCHHAEGLQAQYQSISESVASDGENTADESGALVICEDATLESSKGPEDVEDRLDDSTSAKCVLGGETALASPNCSADTLTVNSSRDESHAAAFPVATSRPCLESDSVALINIRVAADVITSFSASAEAASSNSFGAEVSSTDETSGHYSASHPDALGSELAGITGSLEALSGNLPVAGILSAVTDVISSSGDSTLVASAAIPSESVSLPFAMSLAVANTPTSDVLPSVQPMAVSACATLSADLTDIPVETLVPPVDLTDVDPMDVSIDTLVPLVDRADCVGNDAEMVSGGVDKMEVKSSSADSTFDAFSLASFPPLGVSDALVDGPSLAKPEPTVVVSNSAAVVVESVDGEGSLLSTTEHVSVGAKSIGLVQENQIALSPETKSSPCSSDVVPSVMSLSSTELVSSGELNVVGASVSPSGGAAVCASANGSVATELSSLPVEIDTGCQTADANAVSIQPELSMCEMAPSSEMQRPSSAAASESNKPCVESAGSGDAAVHPADIDNASHTNSSEVFDVVSSSAGDVGNTNGSSDDLSATPVTSDGCKTVAVSCPDVRSADDARKVPSSSSFPPVLSDCHVGSSLMSS